MEENLSEEEEGIASMTLINAIKIKEEGNTVAIYT